MLQKQGHLNDLLLKQVPNKELRRAAEDAKLEVDMGIHALQVELALRRKIVENSYSYPANRHPDIERDDNSHDRKWLEQGNVGPILKQENLGPMLTDYPKSWNFGG